MAAATGLEDDMHKEGEKPATNAEPGKQPTRWSERTTPATMA